MRLHLDDNSASPLLARLLRQAGHEVQLPGDVGLAGAPDAVHSGFDIPNVFVAGYGLDFNDEHRHLPHVAMLEVALAVCGRQGVASDHRSCSS